MKSVIEKFYCAFEKLDADTMISCYDNDVSFYDPAFGLLKGEDAKIMWRILCDNQKGKKFKLKASNVYYDDENEVGGAHWEAFYVFSLTGRKIHNIVEAEFKFKNGKIIKHVDDFSLHNWSRQAFGFVGQLIGGTEFFKKRLNVQSNKLIIDYKKK